MAAEPSTDLAARRAVAMRVATTLIGKGDKASAVEILTVWASAANDAEGHTLLAEALRHGSDNPLAKAAFAKMEGIAGDTPGLQEARTKWEFSVVEALDKEQQKKPVGGWQAEVGYNNNVKYKDQTFHIQTEDSGVKRPHIITHLFADGGRILKSFKRPYVELVGQPDLSKHVRAWMKGQHKEMYIALREGRFDGIIEGREHGGMETYAGPPNPEARKRPEGASQPSIPDIAKPAAVEVAPAAPVPVKEVVVQAPTRARLHVIRALGDGPILHELRADASSLGRAGDVQIVGDRYVSPNHATLSFRNGKLEIEDAGSVSGVFLRIRQPVELELGDVFIAGDQVLKVEGNPPPNDGPDSSPTYFYSSPKWPTTYRLVQMWEGGVPGLTVVARSNSLQIGRTGCDLCFPQDFWLSDQHCLVEDQGGFLMLTDLGSRGGTFVRVKGPTRLSTGDEILIGRTRLRVEIVNRPSGLVSAVS